MGGAGESEGRKRGVGGPGGSHLSALLKHLWRWTSWRLQRNLGPRQRGTTKWAWRGSLWKGNCLFVATISDVQPIKWCSAALVSKDSNWEERTERRARSHCCPLTPVRLCHHLNQSIKAPASLPLPKSQMHYCSVELTRNFIGKRILGNVVPT